MKTVAKQKEPQLIVKSGKPSAVIIGINEYRRLLEMAENWEDLKILEEMEKRPLKFRSLEEYLAEHSRDI